MWPKKKKNEKSIDTSFYGYFICFFWKVKFTYCFSKFNLLLVAGSCLLTRREHYYITYKTEVKFNYNIWFKLWPQFLFTAAFSYLCVALTWSLIFLSVSSSFYSHLQCFRYSGIWGHCLQWTSRSDWGSSLRRGPPELWWRDRRRRFRRGPRKFQQSWYSIYQDTWHSALVLVILGWSSVKYIKYNGGV